MIACSKFFKKIFFENLNSKSLFFFFINFHNCCCFLLLLMSSYWLLFMMNFSSLTVISLFFHFNHAQVEQIIFKHFHSFRSSTVKIFSFFFSSLLVTIYGFPIDHFFYFNQCHQKSFFFCSIKLSSSINFKHIKQIRQLSDKMSYKIKLL